MRYFDYLTEFIFREDEPKEADAILLPGGPYGEIAVHAAWLYKKGLAPIVIPSGKYSIVTGSFSGPLSPESYAGRNFETESDFFRQILLDEGVPGEAILQEKEATYTYQNAIFTKALLEKRGITLKKAILSCQAYHAKRCLMYYQLLFPDTEFYVSPAETRGISRWNWYRKEESIELVLREVEHCGSQFHDIMRQMAGLKDLETGVRSEGNDKSSDF